MAAPAWGAAGTYYNPGGTGTSVVLPVPSGIAAGHIILLCLYIESTATVTPPTGFVEIPQTAPTASTTGSVQYSRIFWKRATGAESGSYTLTWSGAAFRAGVAVRFTGVVATGNPWDVTDTNGRSSNGTVTPAVAVTTTGIERLLVWIGTSWTDVTWTPPTGFTERVDADFTGIATREWPTASNTGNVTGTSSSSHHQTGWLIALKPSSTVLTTIGIGSGIAIGDPTVTPGPVSLTDAGGIEHTHPMGVAAVAQVLQPTGIPSALAFGQTVADGGIHPDGIPHDHPMGIVIVGVGAVSLTTEGIPEPFPRFGTASIIESVLAPVGIPPKGTTFGTANITRGPRTLTANSIIHPTVFGTANVALFTTALTTQILVRPKLRVSYDLVMAARIPQPSGPPTFFEIESLPWTDIKYGQKLSTPDTLDATIKVSTLTEGMKQRLRTPSEIPTELWLYRNGKRVFAGPMAGGGMQGDNLNLSANGSLAYLQWMFVRADLVYKNSDQFTIVKGLVDQWQNVSYANFGIDTANVGVSGVTFDMTFVRNEQNMVYDRVMDMSNAANGFDISIDPVTRALQLHFPHRGVDRSDDAAGPEAIVFDDRNVTDTNIVFSIGPNDLATEVAGVGTGSGQDQADTYYSSFTNDELMVKFGRVGLTGSFRDVTSQAQNDQHTQSMLNARRETLWIPGPNVRVTPDSDLDSYDVGDTVSYHLHNELDIQGAFRLLARDISVDENMNESVSASFV